MLCSVLKGTNNLGSLLDLKLKRGSLMSSSKARIFGLKRVLTLRTRYYYSVNLFCLLTEIKTSCVSGGVLDQRRLSLLYPKRVKFILTLKLSGVSMCFSTKLLRVSGGSKYRTGLSHVFKMPVCSGSLGLTAMPNHIIHPTSFHY